MANILTSDVHVAALGPQGLVRADRRLPRPIRFRGPVSHGEHRGREIGFPTANLYFADERLLPPDGVYAGFVRDLTDDVELLGASAISIGTNPTFGRYRRRLEAHILDFDADIYDRTIEVNLTHWIRGMTRFTGADQLVATIKGDVALVARLCQPVASFADQ